MKKRIYLQNGFHYYFKIVSRLPAKKGKDEYSQNFNFTFCFV
jgi:hypothetical protein